MNANTTLENEQIASAADPAENIGQTSLAKVTHTLSEFDRVQAGLAELNKKFKNVVFAVATTQGMADAKAARVAIREPRYAIDKIAKAAKDPLNELKKNIDARALSITNALVELETPIHEQIKVEEDRKAAEKAAREQAERQRVEKVNQAIEGIRSTSVQAVGKSAAEIDKLRQDLAAVVPSIDDFGDRAGEAMQAQMQVLATLDSLHSAAVNQEEAAKQAAADRAELDRMKAEQAERQRAEDAAREAQRQKEQDEREATQRAEAKKLADERAKFESEQVAASAALKAESEKLAAERKKWEDERAAEQKRLDDIEAEKKAAAEEQQRAEREEQERVARQAAAAEQARLDAVAAAQREEADRQAREKRAAEEAAHQAEQRGRGSWRVLLAALEGLVNEPQPLGIERPTYQASLAAITAAKGDAA